MPTAWMRKGLLLLGVWMGLCPWAGSLLAQAPKTNYYLAVIQGTVEVLPAGSRSWAPGKLNQILNPGDRVATREKSRAAVCLGQEAFRELAERSDYMIPLPETSSFLKGLFRLFDKRRGQFNAGMTGAIRGTDYLIRVEEGRVEVTVIDGEVALSNAVGQVIVLTNGQRGVLQNGLLQGPAAVVETANDLLAWSLYYPAVTDVEELPFSALEREALAVSLAAYRSGDILRALAEYPWDRVASSDTEKTYQAALLLAVGQVDRSELILQSQSARSPGGQALRQLIAAVKFEPWEQPGGFSAAELMAESYYQQSRGRLEPALKAARAAVTKSPRFGIGWARVADLEFSFGRTSRALEALEKGLLLAPRNASGVALKGFLFSAQNRIGQAIQLFSQAIDLDSGLGSAWLGRGLCRIRSGALEAGERDLFAAAALEPHRAVFRSYLGKTLSLSGKDEQAIKELELAKRLDPRDPTAWLYSALYNQQQNRINRAIRELEHSQDLVANRGVYRSELLLDQDRGVRSANLASIYFDAGMVDVSVREAARAVNSDYANFSAHLFLANSFDRLRDPALINLRYETPAFSEYLVANLLAPVGAGTLSPTISQQEYSKLFERDGLGVTSVTEYWSRGDWAQSGAQFGAFGNTSYSLEASYRSQRGDRPNNDVERMTFSQVVRQQLTPKDTVYLQAIEQYSEGGNLLPYYDPDSAALQPFRFEEKQAPILLAGYHRSWAPGNDTLFLFGHVNDSLEVDNPEQRPPVLVQNIGLSGDLEVTEAGILAALDQHYKNRVDLFSAELQQVLTQPRHSTVLGARFQWGEFNTRNKEEDLIDLSNVIGQAGVGFEVAQKVESDFQRLNIYGYHHWQIADSLQLIGGVSFDWLKIPRNIRVAPLEEGEDRVDRISPKAGLIWTPGLGTTVRAAYTRGLGGFGPDQSYRLEPTQVAGFNQAFRSIIPEAVSGTLAGADFEAYDISFEQEFRRATYLGVGAELLKSDVDQQAGALAFDISAAPGTLTPVNTKQSLDYEELTLVATLNQLIGQRWSLGARYQVSYAQLESEFDELGRDIPTTDDFSVKTRIEGILQQLQLHAIFNHPSGFFAHAQGVWYDQRNDGYADRRGNEDFWQFHAFAGYRFFRRRAELRVGILNITDRDYRLSPLNLHASPPRERTFVASLRLNF